MAKFKVINELTTEELRKVFESNEQLQSEVMDDMADSEMFWIREQLDFLADTLEDYSVGQCNRNQHITVADPAGFIRALAELQRNMAMLPNDYDDRIEEALELADRYKFADVDSDDEYHELEAQVEEEAQELADILAEEYARILDDYCLDYENAEDYFINFYAHELMDSSFYVDSEYILYEKVSYTRVYA